MKLKFLAVSHNPAGNDGEGIWGITSTMVGEMDVRLLIPGPATPALRKYATELAELLEQRVAIYEKIVAD